MSVAPFLAIVGNNIFTITVCVFVFVISIKILMCRPKSISASCGFLKFNIKFWNHKD